MRRAIAVAAALVAGTGLIGVAQPAGQDALKAEVSAAWEEYLERYIGFDDRDDGFAGRILLDRTEDILLEM